MMYLWIKAAHIIFVVSWVASLLVYPRYKIHQLSAKPGEPLFETMKEASARLRRIVMLPSLIAVWVLGIALLAQVPGVFSTGIWMWVKLLLVICMTGFHGYYVKTGKAIDKGEATVSVNKLKLMNEMPFILLIGIVILVIVRPI